MTFIQASNLRAHLAVVAARINPCIETRTELRDALSRAVQAVIRDTEEEVKENGRPA